MWKITKTRLFVCPKCHRRAHYSRDAVEYNEKLAEVVQKLEIANVRLVFGSPEPEEEIVVP
jgi:hypothetical protein